MHFTNRRAHRADRSSYRSDICTDLAHLSPDCEPDGPTDRRPDSTDQFAYSLAFPQPDVEPDSATNIGTNRGSDTGPNSFPDSSPDCSAHRLGWWAYLQRAVATRLFSAPVPDHHVRKAGCRAESAARSLR